MECQWLIFYYKNEWFRRKERWIWTPLQNLPKGLWNIRQIEKNKKEHMMKLSACVLNVEFWLLEKWSSWITLTILINQRVVLIATRLWTRKAWPDTKNPVLELSKQICLVVNHVNTSQIEKISWRNTLKGTIRK